MGFYLLGKQGQVAQWGALVRRRWLAAVVVFFTSEPGKQFMAFGRDSVQGSQEGRLADAQGSRCR